MTSQSDIDAVQALYPASLSTEASRGMSRDIYHLDVLAGALPRTGRVLDLGGGFAAHNAALAARGHRVSVIDMFRGYWSDRDVDVEALIGRFENAGVEMIEADLVEWTPPTEQRFDLIFSAHCFEHFHHSPMPLLRRCLASLQPGGKLIICVPNAVNARKRLMMIAGRTNHAPFEEFFLNDGPFLGHVREYSVGDLEQLANHLELRETRVWGRNWLGLSRVSSTHLDSAAAIADRVLRVRPGLCSDLYLSGSIYQPGG